MPPTSGWRDPVAQQAELVALRVGQHVPGLFPALPDVGVHGPGGEQPVQLAVLVAVGGAEVGGPCRGLRRGQPPPAAGHDPARGLLIPTRSSTAGFVLFRYGGCGIVPSGAFHLELPTTVPNREWRPATWCCGTGRARCARPVPDGDDPRSVLPTPPVPRRPPFRSVDGARSGRYGWRRCRANASARRVSSSSSLLVSRGTANCSSSPTPDATARCRSSSASNSAPSSTATLEIHNQTRKTMTPATEP